ncbi:ATP-independent RNA helicase dbpA [Serratia fonticola]|uniref:ATP-independent RNA helicase dbpA n=1 Tax=Serratia fonticola TaxID=47917 RepID=A0A4U9W3B8_SERFO|nr:ATP-independent RNA helicase dbpA [Serratia fonticola]
MRPTACWIWAFADDIDDVISYTPPQRQTLLFSATYPAGIERISARVQRQPLNVEVEDGDEQASIEQRFYETTRESTPCGASERHPSLSASVLRGVL